MRDIPVPALATGVAAVVVYVALSLHNTRFVSTLRARTHFQMFGAYASMIALWPLVWAIALGESRRDSIALPSLLWPIVIIAIDMVGMRHSTFESHAESRKSLMNMDANAICSLTFALSSIVSAQEDACCKRIFLFAVLFCVAFVLPSIHSSSSSSIPITIEAAQKGVLAYATGLLLAGVLIASKRSPAGKSTA